jgi:predicted Zn-dependent protease with MMP-like domain
VDFVVAIALGATVAVFLVYGAVSFVAGRRRLRAYVESDDGADEPPVEDAQSDFFESLVVRAIARLPAEQRAQMSNVEIVVEDEPPGGLPLLGLYTGVPLTRRSSWYAWAPPDKITLYRGPLERLYGHDRALLAAEVEHTVLHEIAHHFGISDARLVELDRY